MSLVYCKISIPFADDFPMFFKKLNAFVGDFRIEPHSIDDWLNNKIIVISFYTDKIEFKEGESRQVILEAQRKNYYEWDFTKIEKVS